MALGVHFNAPPSPYYGKDGKAPSMHPPSVVALYENTSFDSPQPSIRVQNYTGSCSPSSRDGHPPA